MQDVGNAFRRGGVAVVYLVHGTFTGVDATGILSELGRLLPGARDTLGRLAKTLVDAVAGDHGNYAAEYAKLFESAINRRGQELIPVRLLHWSSENHHLGRADGAVRLLDELAAERTPQGPVLLWGHSHAGNVFALLTNLLAGDRDSVDRFLSASRIYYRVPCFGHIDLPHWRRVVELLQRDAPRLDERPLDIVTFGTPVRYGWDTGGYRHLLHFVNHRPLPRTMPYLAEFPPKLDDVLSARGGDTIQQIGIAGTNSMPSPITWRTWKADYNLHGLLQPNHRKRDLLDRLQTGMRVPDEGTTLLVDYGMPSENAARHMAGHAVYTQREWLLFHAEQVAERFYGDQH